MKIASTVDIDAPLEKVFHWLSDPDRAMAWMTSVKSYEIIDDVPGKIGTTFRETIEEDGQGLEMHGTISDCVENETFAVHLESPVNTVDVRFSLTVREGKTRLVQDVEMTFKIEGMNSDARLISMIRDKIARGTKEDFIRLEALCLKKDR